MMTWCRKAGIQTFVLVCLLPYFTPAGYRSSSQTGLGTRNAAASEPISAEEYDVYSDLFNALRIHKRDGKDVPLLVIGTETVGPTMDEVRRAAACQQDVPVGEPLPPRSSYLLSAEFRSLVDDLLIKNKRTDTFNRRFNLRRPYLLLRDSDFRGFFNHPGEPGFDRFYKQYPRADGFKVLSRIGFNSPMTLALVYVESSYTPIDAFTTFVLLRKSDDGWIRVEAYTCANWRAGIKPDVP
jgi:hypothetical protein